MCDQTIAFGTLVCQRTTEHDPGHGCVFAATAGADLSSERGEE